MTTGKVGRPRKSTWEREKAAEREGEQTRGPFPPPGFFLDDPENEKESGRLGEDSARSGEAAPSVRDGGAGVDEEGNGGGGTRPIPEILYGDLRAVRRETGGADGPSVQATGPAVPDGGRIVPREA